jgi:hypothetical protein
VNHIRSSVSCGHYTANALKLGNDDDMMGKCFKSREWLPFNDEYVSRLSKEKAMEEKMQKSAHMLMYEFE